MADVTAKAKRRGQLPNGVWVQEGDEFTIDSKLFSSRWMVKLSSPKRRSAKATADDGEAS